jgi:uncharacterized protein YndB with AHSA1/START domain
MGVIRLTYEIKAPVEAVWRCLTDPVEIDKWEGGPAKMEDKVGAAFEFWGGDIHGKNLEVVPSRKLVQEWEYGDWANPSKVTFELQPEGDSTLLTLVQDGHPDEEENDLINGWKGFYLGAIKNYLESTG